jgi:hypothetical protein
MRWAAVLALMVLASCAPAASSERSASPTATPSLAPPMKPQALAIFDMHMHYSREAWDDYPPGTVAKLMNENGIAAALVSSAPDEGTFKLKAVLGDRIVPTLGPYRSGEDVVSWTRDPTTIARVQSAYRAGVHRGFGEFHLKPGEAALPTVRNAIAFAARERLFLHADANVQSLGELLEAAPGAIVLGAHAGLDGQPDQIAALLERWPNLWIELSVRDFDLAFRGELDPRWSAVLVKYHDRFMVGTDTWLVGRVGVNARWDAFGEIVKGIRAWLRLLPPDVGEAIAHGNAERFFAQLPR